MKNFIKEISKIVALGLVLVVVQAFAFTEPSQAPPGGNVPAPLNVGSAGQSKSGGLILNTGGAANGLIIDQGSVGIGTQSPSQKLDVIGYVRGATGLCIGGDCRTGWPGEIVMLSSPVNLRSGPVLFVGGQHYLISWTTQSIAAITGGDTAEVAILAVEISTQPYPVYDICDNQNGVARFRQNGSTAVSGLPRVVAVGSCDIGSGGGATGRSAAMLFVGLDSTEAFQYDADVGNGGGELYIDLVGYVK